MLGLANYVIRSEIKCNIFYVETYGKLYLGFLQSKTKQGKQAIHQEEDKRNPPPPLPLNRYRRFKLVWAVGLTIINSTLLRMDWNMKHQGTHPSTADVETNQKTPLWNWATRVATMPRKMQ